jgi:hypothetical protein
VSRGRVDRDRQRRHVLAEVVERAADGLGLGRAGVVAGRVEEGHDHRLAAQVAHRDPFAVLVAQREVRRAHAGGHPRALEVGAAGVGLVLRVGREHDRPEREQRH